MDQLYYKSNQTAIILFYTKYYYFYYYNTNNRRRRRYWKNDERKKQFFQINAEQFKNYNPFVSTSLFCFTSYPLHSSEISFTSTELTVCT